MAYQVTDHARAREGVPDSVARTPLTIGKLRGLQQLSDRDGRFAMCALDHRDSMRRMIAPAAPDSVGDPALIEYKRDLTDCLAPAATAVLLDPIFGAAQAIAGGVLPGDTGLLVSLEETGYEQAGDGRLTALLPGWGVEQAKRMGASAVKILLYYHPDSSAATGRQREVARQVAADCARADIPFLLEPIAYPADDAERDPAVFAARKPDLVVRSAQELTPLGVDVLKAEFPADLRFERDEGRLREACERLHAASRAPWILLSAGVAFEEFARQVRIACQAGASGFLGGRAIWGEAMHLGDRSARREWLATVGADRLRRLHDIAGEWGRPWWRKWAAAPGELVDIEDGWYRRY